MIWVETFCKRSFWKFLIASKRIFQTWKIIQVDDIRYEYRTPPRYLACHITESCIYLFFLISCHLILCYVGSNNNREIRKSSCWRSSGPFQQDHLFYFVLIPHVKQSLWNVNGAFGRGKLFCDEDIQYCWFDQSLMYW